MANLTTQATSFTDQLEELGVGCGLNDRINDADLTDAVCRNLDLLSKLPALCELADAVEKLVKAKGRFHTEQNYKALADALNKLKGA